MPLDQGGESQLGSLTVTRRELLQDLSIGQIANASEMEERSDLSLNGTMLCGRHGSVLRRPPNFRDISNVTRGGGGCKRAPIDSDRREWADRSHR